MLLPIVFTIIKILIIVTVILLAVAYMTYAERKVIGAMQVRLGPMHTGPYGLLQPIADAVKLIAKEDLTPDMVDRPVFILAPLLTMVPALAGFAVIPFADNFTMFGMEIKPYITDLNIGLLYVLAISSVGTYGVIMSGWASNSKYALLGSLRSSAQVLSYETAMGLALVAPVLLAGSLSLREITLAQSGMWFVVPQIVAFMVYLIAAIAETNRAPFDLAEAETEIVAGFHVEYSSMKFALFFLGEYANMYLVSTIAVVMFLGGWNGPFLPPLVWFVLKVLFIMFIFLWLRATLPRLRFDQLMSLGWKVLIPIALANLMITAIVVHIVR
ncbi:MAG: NADH-quinone oxidoreductase subunit NuoH [Geovibrio sp.]|jgi:NADH-quinone oxidoreductase subunit H|uniref:NADH-quinone oxidoreductase subunit NuoH n=1 Tax=Geovibrio ferrireducens TaxID=46201 RepID=UPI0022460CE9|nr:NADH-quinone oxidoreductase subunit NuoH [Geovibrio ferrireducens]MCD8492064.1 NADH-quinone oxidoreductase subunit NuoH [Geovibrio sp.]MCD8568265.1 NADH-quinone oxidoreductase subunit NuoH [Geovibrio sp.]